MGVTVTPFVLFFPASEYLGASMLFRREGRFSRVKKRGRVLKKVCVVRGQEVGGFFRRGGVASSKGGGGFLRRGGWLLKKGGGFLRTLCQCEGPEGVRTPPADPLCAPTLSLITMLPRMIEFLLPEESTGKRSKGKIIPEKRALLLSADFKDPILQCKIGS